MLVSDVNIDRPVISPNNSTSIHATDKLRATINLYTLICHQYVSVTHCMSLALYSAVPTPMSGDTHAKIFGSLSERTSVREIHRVGRTYSRPKKHRRHHQVRHERQKATGNDSRSNRHVFKI